MFGLIVTAVLVGASLWYVKGTGLKTRLKETLLPEPAHVRRTRPANGDTGVLPNEFVAADVHLPNFGHGVDAATLTPQTVKLYRNDDGKPVDANVNTSAAGDSIVLQPTKLLDPGVTYTFEVTPGVRDTRGTAFTRHTSSFTTSAVTRTSDFPARFERVDLDHAADVYTGLTFGPDGKLYACTYDGKLIRWTLEADGTLGARQEIPTVRVANRGPRLIVGLHFDPASTPADPVLWITHGVLAEEGAPDWSSKLSRLSGPDLDRYQDVVVGLPRSYGDHLTNQLDFGPDGCIYFVQGSNTATGAPDARWGGRTERLLTAAMLRVDPRLITNPPLDVRTEEAGTSDDDADTVAATARGGKRRQPYDPFAPGAPVTIHATGIRLGYEALWHSSGHLFTAVNGSAAGGRTPAHLLYEDNDADSGVRHRTDLRLHGPYREPAAPALTNVAARPDFLFRVEPGGYYGHPNPRRAEYVLDGGNPSAATDVAEVTEYPVGTRPDRNWRPPALVFGKNVSPNGMVEYRSDAFGGVLKNHILVCRFSGGDDIVALAVDAAGAIGEVVVGIDGFGKFLDPLDLAHDPKTGRVYVAEYEGRKLTLLRPAADAAGRFLSRQVFRMAVSPQTRAPIR